MAWWSVISGLLAEGSSGPNTGSMGGSGMWSGGAGPAAGWCRSLFRWSHNCQAKLRYPKKRRDRMWLWLWLWLFSLHAGLTVVPHNTCSHCNGHSRGDPINLVTRREQTDYLHGCAPSSKDLGSRSIHMIRRLVQQLVVWLNYNNLLITSVR